MSSPAQAIRIIGDLTPGDHLCALYETEEEHRAALTLFLRHGLDRGEKVLCLVDAHTSETVQAYLRDDGLDVVPYLTSGQLTLLTAADAYMPGGAFDPDWILTRLRAELERTRTEGYASLRVAEEMTWALRGPPGGERLVEYERKLDASVSGSRLLALCQYDRRRFDPALLLEVLPLHPLVVIGTEVYSNVYYTPPGVFRGDPPAARLQRWIAALVERKRAETALRQAEEESWSIVEHAVEGIFQSSPDGRILAANPALARMLGYASPEALIAAITDIAQQLHVNPQRREEFGLRLQADGIVQGFEMQVRRQDGRPIWVSASARAVRDAQGTLRHYEGIMEDITARKQAEEVLRQSREQLRALAAHLESVREEERSAAAQVVHDELGQGLAGLKIQLTQVAAQLTEDRPALRETVAEMIALIDPMIHAARRISEELRPSLLDLVGLGAALEGLAQEFQARTSIGCRVTAEVATLPLDRVQATALFRICQESLANVAQHARATHATIRVEEEANQLILTVEDDGRGITDEAIASRASVGLIRMRERALFLGGDLTIAGRPGQGTTVTLRMPLKRT